MGYSGSLLSSWSQFCYCSGLDLSAMSWAVAPIYRSHCKVRSLAKLLGGVLTSGSPDAVSLFQMFCGYFHVVTHGVSRCGLNMLCQSCSAYSRIWITPWAWISVHLLGCSNLLCALKLVAIRHKSCFHCCQLDHTKPPSKLLPWESAQNTVIVLCCCRYLLLLSVTVGIMWSPHYILPAWASSFPSHHALNLNCLHMS